MADVQGVADGDSAILSRPEPERAAVDHLSAAEAPERPQGGGGIDHALVRAWTEATCARLNQGFKVRRIPFHSLRSRGCGDVNRRLVSNPPDMNSPIRHGGVILPDRERRDPPRKNGHFLIECDSLFIA